jgi:hypothetical protein
VSRPPAALILVGVLMIALGETAGAALSLLRPQIARYARARVAANPQAHGLAGSAEYDVEVTRRAVFAAEAGLSFFHTHAEGLGLIVLLVGSVVAGSVPQRRARGALQALLAVGGLFPLGYLAYSLAVLEVGRDSGIETVEAYVLAPLGSAAIVALVGVVVALLAGRGRTRPA